MKGFAIFAGVDYYPNGGWDDFVTAYDTLPEAIEAVRRHASGGIPVMHWAHVVDMELRRQFYRWKMATQEQPAMEDIVPHPSTQGVEELVITPWAAEQMLKYWRPTRMLNQAWVNRFAAMMANGEWQLTSDAISVYPVTPDYPSGSYCHGRKRMLAVVQSGVACPFTIVHRQASEWPWTNGG